MRKNNASNLGPGRAYRQGISTVELFRMFPNDRKAEKWFEEQRWPNGERYCPDCGSLNTAKATHPRMPYRCRDCRKFFSVRKGTIMQDSKVGFQKWAFCLYLTTTSLKGVSSMKIYREVGVTQKTAWHLIHRIREAFASDPDPRLRFPGPVEIDEAYFGGKESNKHKDKKLNAGRGTVGKQAVVSVRDRDSKEVRAQLVPDTKADTLQGEVDKHVEPDAVKFTDEHAAYEGLQNRQTVSHGTGEYVAGMAHVNGCESFWAMLKRGYHGTFHRMSFKSATLRERIRRASQYPRSRHYRTDVPAGEGAGGQAAPVQGLDRPLGRSSGRCYLGRRTIRRSPAMKPGTLYFGDCLELMQEWPDECVDLIYCRPYLLRRPFSIRDYFDKRPPVLPAMLDPYTGKPVYQIALL